MEYVIVAVLVAAASVIAVVVFSRSVVTMFTAASQGATLEHTKTRDELHMRQQDRLEDIEVAEDYHDYMHE